MSKRSEITVQTATGNTHGEKSKNRQAHHEQTGNSDALAQANKPPDKIVITPEIATRFQQGIKRFYEHGAGTSLKEAYRRTLQHYFQVGHELHNGVLVPLLPPVEQLPTFRQFQHWYKRQVSSRQAFLSPDKNCHTGNSSRARACTMQSNFGPGTLYQIDAVTSDIQVIGSLEPRHIIGRPTIYLIRDVFSQMIVGINIGWERPNWRGVMLALENAAEEKVSFCQHYGVAITEAAWPAHHLPQALLIENPGKFEGISDSILDDLVVSLGIRVDNTFSFANGWRTAINRRGRLFVSKFISSLLKIVEQVPQQGGPGRGITLRQLRRLMIYTILHYNLEHSMGWYPLDDNMIADQVEPYPIQLWNWGIQYRPGHLRTMDPQMIRRMLLPQGEASVTNQEILFQGLSYRCSLSLEELLLTSVQVGNQQRIPVIYNPQLVDVIYLQLDEGQRLAPCYLAEQECHLVECAWQEFQHPFEAEQQRDCSPPQEPPEHRHVQGSREIT